MFYSTIMKIDSIDRLRDIRDALLVEQGINPTRQGEQAIKVVVERIDEIQATLDKSASIFFFFLSISPVAEDTVIILSSIYFSNISL